MHRLGIVHAARTLRRRGCRILLYHHFPSDHSQLAAQCEHIRRYYHPISLRQVSESFSTGAPLPDNSLAVTVDDGYRDFLLHGHPVFWQYEIPVTVFLITGFIDQELWPWWDQITYVFQRTQHSAISFAGESLSISGDVNRVAFRAAEALKRLPNDERKATLEELVQSLEVELPRSAPVEYEPLTWDEVRRLGTLGVELGCHTRTHPILSRVLDGAELTREIVDSKKRLDEKMGFPALHFAYPNGTRVDYNDQTIQVVRQCGFATAVTAESGFNYESTSQFELLRLGVVPSLPEKRFVELLAGLRRY